jgi:hypothetical protein
MILMGANPLLGPMKGVGPENLDFFGPKKVSVFKGPLLPMAQVMDLPASKSLRPALINNRYVHINNNSFRFV